MAAEKRSRRLLAAPLLTGGMAGDTAGNCGVGLPCDLRVSLSLQGFFLPFFQHVLRPKDFGGMRQIPTIFSVSWALCLSMLALNGCLGLRPVLMSAAA
jgi:hypothetical protein